MKKKFVLILLLITIELSVNAQLGYFNNTYNFFNNHIAGLSIVKEDTTVVTASVFTDSLNNQRINFSRFTLDGILIYQKNFGYGPRDYFSGRSGSLQKVSDGGFILSGAVVDSINMSAFILKINQNFDSVFFKEFKDTIYHSIEFQQGKETFDKGFISVGDIQTGTHTGALLIIKTDSLGNQVFKKTYSLIGIDYVRDLIETPDKGFLLGCYSWDYYNAAYSGDPWIMKLDSLGNYEWSKKYGGPNQDGPAIVTIDNDSNYIITYGYAYMTIPQVCSSFFIDVLKIDKNGSIIWDKKYDTISIGTPKMIKVLTNGDIVVIGSGSTINPISWVLKLKPNGDEKYFHWFYKFNDSHTIDNTAYDFCILNDNSIIVCGDVQQDTMYQSLWLVKIDSNGCLQPGCNNVGIEEIKYQKQEILNVYPNPAKDYFIVEYKFNNEINGNRLEVVDALGHNVKSFDIIKKEGQLIIDSHSLTKGTYFCILLNNVKIYSRAKVTIN